MLVEKMLTQNSGKLLSRSEVMLLFCQVIETKGARAFFLYALTTGKFSYKFNVHLSI